MESGMNAASKLPGLLLVVGLVTAGACTRHSESAPAQPQSGPGLATGVASGVPALWEPVDPSFTGCAGG